MGGGRAPLATTASFIHRIICYTGHSLNFDNTMAKKTIISAEELALFRDAMREVTPLNQPCKPRVHRSTGSQREQNEIQPFHNPYYLYDDYTEPVLAETILNFCRNPLSKKQTHALATGQIVYEATLDLHGHVPEQAKHQLGVFIHRQLQQHKRTLLIIHGKGGRYHNVPVLKNLINQWLMQISDVLAFHSAHPRHGGTGSVYVLLRKT